MKRFNIVEKSHLWTIIASVIVLLSIIFFCSSAHYSEEFTWWATFSLYYDQDASQIQETFENFLFDQGYPDARVYLNQEGSNLTVKITSDFSQGDTENVDMKVSEFSNSIKTFLSKHEIIASSEADLTWWTLIGPSVGDYMRSTAFKALFFGVFLMVVYMLFAFGKIRKEIPAEVLISTVFCVLVFDLCATLGVYAVWMFVNPTIQVDTIFITALLTIVAYGINDVIVIFDRIRENILKASKEKSLHVPAIVEESLWQTMRRSVWTSFSTLLVLVWMFCFCSGASVLQQFAFTVWMGIIVSTCSSIFLWWSCTNLFMKVFKKRK